MSTSWITPVEDWGTGNGIGYSDLNRIEGNLDYIREQDATFNGDKVFSDNVTVNDTLFLNDTDGVTNLAYQDSGVIKFAAQYSSTSDIYRIYALDTTYKQAFGIFRGTQNVIIGTSSTDNGYGLDVEGTTRIQSDLTVGGSTELEALTVNNDLTVNMSEDASLNIFSSGTTETNATLYIGRSSTRTSYIKSSIDAATAGNGTDLFFGTNSAGSEPTDKILLSKNGNLIVGSSPTDSGYKLDINGTARIQSDLTVSEDLTVSGDTTVEALTVNGDIYGYEDEISIFADVTVDSLTVTGNTTFEDLTVNQNFFLREDPTYYSDTYTSTTTDIVNKGWYQGYLEIPDISDSGNYLKLQIYMNGEWVAITQVSGSSSGLAASAVVVFYSTGGDGGVSPDEGAVRILAYEDSGLEGYFKRFKY